MRTLPKIGFALLGTSLVYAWFKARKAGEEYRVGYGEEESPKILALFTWAGLGILAWCGWKKLKA